MTGIGLKVCPKIEALFQDPNAQSREQSESKGASIRQCRETCRLLNSHAPFDYSLAALGRAQGKREKSSEAIDGSISGQTFRTGFDAAAFRAALLWASGWEWAWLIQGDFAELRAETMRRRFAAV